MIKGCYKRNTALRKKKKEEKTEKTPPPQSKNHTKKELSKNTSRGVFYTYYYNVSVATVVLSLLSCLCFSFGFQSLQCKKKWLEQNTVCRGWGLTTPRGNRWTEFFPQCTAVRCCLTGRQGHCRCCPCCQFAISQNAAAEEERERTMLRPAAPWPSSG